MPPGSMFRRIDGERRQNSEKFNNTRSTRAIPGAQETTVPPCCANPTAPLTNRTLALLAVIVAITPISLGLFDP